MHVLKISLTTALLVLLMGVPAMAQSSKVGFVNPQRIINESKLGRIAQNDLARLGKEKDRRVRQALDRVEKLKTDLKSDVLSVTDQQSMENNLREAGHDYEDLVKASNREIQEEERRLIQFVMRHADLILREIAQKQGFTMILTDPEIVGYVDNSMDLTDEVIRALNAKM